MVDGVVIQGRVAHVQRKSTLSRLQQLCHGFRLSSLGAQASILQLFLSSQAGDDGDVSLHVELKPILSQIDPLNVGHAITQCSANMRAELFHFVAGQINALDLAVLQELDNFLLMIIVDSVVLQND